MLEQRDAPGGRAYVYRQDGFTFDGGPTIVTAPFLLDELWALCGRSLADDVDIVPITPFYRIRFDDGAVFDYTGDADAMRAEIARFCPADVPGYDRFMAASEAIYRVGFEQLGAVPFSNWTDMARVAPALIKLEGYRSVHSLVAKHISDPRLRQALSFHPLLVGGNPFAASAIYALIAFLERRYGVHYVMGGTGALVAGMVRLIERQGGQVRCNQAVAAITVQDGAATGVRLADDTAISAAVVVSNADSATTYRTLLAETPRRTWTDRRVERARYSMSLFVWYFGTSRQYPDVAHHTILLGPRYKALLADIFQHHVVAEDFSLYLHRPTATDPAMAPPGQDCFYVLSPVPHLASGTDWPAFAETYRARIAAALEATVLPGLGAALATSRVLTPQDFQDTLSSYHGAAFGMEPILMQSAYFRPHNLSEDVQNLYLVGAGTHPGAGLPGVLCSAKVLDTVVPHGAPTPLTAGLPADQPVGAYV